ncbi:threonine aldolase family protein [Dactylosporangium sucinum]|uniref:Aromatic amino acid beta-eliminating lyase/threonine aldolase domain-containing protein n=1 Tax=Dactylosporangium sucinum TaxID=1424081 RepID=A0A917THY5_9ACTN|nr:GntG family PLP-dependent aldolase [Dactylosporangium sucinum]GGM23862.1 hypothetical protein GCM10007977_026270 [Dactylosporangium sucinum]
MSTYVDLRSDTVTQPSAGMIAAMASAELGDDCYGEDRNVTKLQKRVAEMFGHEAALLMPSGTMANQVALRALLRPGDELLCAPKAHVVRLEAGAAAALGGISTRTTCDTRGLLDAQTVTAHLGSAQYYSNPTRVIAVEQTANLAGGLVYPVETLTDLRKVADESGMAIHCDGARIWHAHIATGTPLPVYGQLFDTLAVCLSKGLGAPGGSLMVGPADLVEQQARRLRQQQGGAMRQVPGLMAAAGLFALDHHHLERLVEDHQRAAALASALADTGVVSHTVQTNIVLLDLSATGWTTKGFAATAAELGVLLAPISDDEVRLVLHLDVTDGQLQHAIRVLSALLKHPMAAAARIASMLRSTAAQQRDDTSATTTQPQDREADDNAGAGAAPTAAGPVDQVMAAAPAPATAAAEPVVQPDTTADTDPGRARRPHTVVRAATTALTFVLALAAAGCGEGPGQAPRTPTVSSAVSSAVSPTVTAEEADARTKAVDAYTNFRKAQVAASANADPQGGDLPNYTADPLLTQLRNDIYLKAQQGLVTTGTPTWKPAVTRVDISTRPFTVDIDDCLDTSAWKTVIKASGKDAAVPDQARRYLVQAKVVQYDDGRWLVNTANAQRDRPC